MTFRLDNQLRFALRFALFEASSGTRFWTDLFWVLTLSVALVSVGTLRAQDSGVAVAWNDFAAERGMLGMVGASKPWPALRPPIPIGLDSVLHSAFGKLYVLSARLSDSLIPTSGPPTDLAVVAAIPEPSAFA